MTSLFDKNIKYEKCPLCGREAIPMITTWLCTNLRCQYYDQGTSERFVWGEAGYKRLMDARAREAHKDNKLEEKSEIDDPDDTDSSLWRGRKIDASSLTGLRRPPPIGTQPNTVQSQKTDTSDNTKMSRDAKIAFIMHQSRSGTKPNTSFDELCDNFDRHFWLYLPLSKMSDDKLDKLVDDLTEPAVVVETDSGMKPPLSGTQLQDVQKLKISNKTSILDGMTPREVNADAFYDKLMADVMGGRFCRYPKKK
ncbi:MAG: hypothetical protein MN733_37245 [Nitrososphaera sp.]|nr:hypothetical protein [Nitrososphaera sp.]